MQSVGLSLLFSVCSFISCSQSFQTGLYSDLIKNDNDGFFKKGQLGIEANYFISPQFAATGGLEWWTDNRVHAVLGTRFSPGEEAYLRFRGLIGEDFSLGAGFAKPLKANFRIEALADFYFKGYIAIRTGIAYRMSRKP